MWLFTGSKPCIAHVNELNLEHDFRNGFPVEFDILKLNYPI